MWNSRRRQEELLTRLDTQNTTLAHLHTEIAELRRQADEQRANQQQSESAWAERVANLQAQLGEYQRQSHDAETQRLKIEELTNVIRGLERGVTGNGAWRQLPPDNAFWQSSREMTRPFVIPFSPDMELMLWIGHARFSTLPITSLILPRSYARRSFVRIEKSEDGGPQRVTESATDVDAMPDGYIALRLGGYAVPPTWIDELIALKAQHDLNMWLVWFLEDKADSQHAGVRVAVACPKQNFDQEPTIPADWREKQVIYFERHPSEYMPVSLPETPVTTMPGDNRRVGPPSQEPSAV